MDPHLQHIARRGGVCLVFSPPLGSFGGGEPFRRYIMKYPIPNTIGYSKEEAIKKLEEYKVRFLYEENEEYAPNVVTSYYEEKDEVALTLSTLPKGGFSRDEKILFVKKVAKVTGPESPNHELLSKADMTSTDLGIPVSMHNGKVAYLYGDSFSGGELNRGIWNSNFLAIAKDEEPHKGLVFIDLYKDHRGKIKPLLQGRHDRNDPSNVPLGKEVTKIPTGGITLGNRIYVRYMSVAYWGEAGEWIVAYNGLLSSDINHLEFVKEEVTFFRDELGGYLGQIYPFENPEDISRVYFLSTKGGRRDLPVILRVEKEKFLEKEEYEVREKEGWKKITEANVDKLYHPLDVAISEPNIVYNPYLHKWLIGNLEDGFVLRYSDSLFTPFKEKMQVFARGDLHAFYGGFLSPTLSYEGGRRIYLQMSEYSPIYNTTMFEVVFK